VTLLDALAVLLLGVLLLLLVVEARRRWSVWSEASRLVRESLMWPTTTRCG